MQPSRLRFLPFVFFFLFLGACGTSEAGLRPARVPATQVLQNGLDRRVGTYVSSPRGFSTSSYWIEGPTGLVLIDTQFLLSEAERMIDWAETTTGKRAVLAIVLHANPDKFNGTSVMQRRGIDVITSQQVVDLIPSVHTLRHGWFYERFAPDYPDQAPQPRAFGDATTEIEAAGLRIKLHVMGPACSEAHVVAEFDHHVFVGDLVANGSHSWLEIGKTDQWLQRLDEIAALEPRFVHPGRGASGGPELIARERGYLERVIEIVRASSPHLDANGEPPRDAIQQLTGEVLAAYPGYTFEVFLRLGVPAEYRRQAGAAAPP